MAKSVNKVILIGNLGKDPEVKYTQTGMAVARFSLATTDRVKDKDGNWQDRTEWHNLVAFQRTAEIAAEYLKKGRQGLHRRPSAQRLLGRQGDWPEEVQDRDHHQRFGAARRTRCRRRRRRTSRASPAASTSALPNPNRRRRHPERRSRTKIFRFDGADLDRCCHP